MEIRKAVFPLAGFGTRMFPITRSIPKEMLPILTKPMLQYAVEEVVNAGITNLIFIVRNQEEILKKYFDSNFTFEKLTKPNHHIVELESLISKINSIKYVKQKIPMGMGDAIRCTKKTVGKEPFAVILTDNLFEIKTESVTYQLLQYFQKLNLPIISTSRVEYKDTSKYGIVNTAQATHNKLIRITDVIEKPSPGTEPSNIAVTGRYILTPDIFPILDEIKKKIKNRNLQLTSAISKLATLKTVYGYRHKKSRWFDCGTPSGLQKASQAFHTKKTKPKDHIITHCISR